MLLRHSSIDCLCIELICKDSALIVNKMISTRVYHRRLFHISQYSCIVKNLKFHHSTASASIRITHVLNEAKFPNRLVGWYEQIHSLMANSFYQMYLWRRNQTTQKLPCAVYIENS